LASHRSEAGTVEDACDVQTRRDHAVVRVDLARHASPHFAGVAAFGEPRPELFDAPAERDAGRTGGFARKAAEASRQVHRGVGIELGFAALDGFHDVDAAA